MDLNTIKFTVDTTELTKAKTALNELASAVDVINKAEQQLSKQNKSVAKTGEEVVQSNKRTAKTSSDVGTSLNKTTNILDRQKDVLKFLAEGFTKGQSSMLAMAKASGLGRKELDELKKTLDSIFKLSGKNPFDDSVDPLKRLTAQANKLKNQMVVLRGETSLTAKQLEEIVILQARQEQLGRQSGLRGAALQSFVNKKTKEYITEAERVNKLQQDANKLLDENTRKAQARANAEKFQQKEFNRGVRESISLLIQRDKYVSKKEFTTQARSEGFTKQQSNDLFRANQLGVSPEQIKQIANAYAEENKQKRISADVNRGLSVSFRELKKQQDESVNAFKNSIGMQKAFEQQIGKGLTNAFTYFGNESVSAFKRAMREQKAFEGSIKQGLSTAFKALGDDSVSSFKRAMREQKAFEGSIKTGLSTAFKALGDDAMSSFKRAMNAQKSFESSIRTGLSNAFKALRSDVQDTNGDLSKTEKALRSVRELISKTGRVVELRQEGFSTTSANQIFRMEKAGVPKAEIDSFKALRKEIDSMSVSKKVLATTTDVLNFKINGLQAAVRALLPGFGALSGAAISATAFAKVIEVADAYSMLQSRLKLTGATSQELVGINQRLLDLSNESRTSLTENTTLYVKLANALKNFGGSQSDALNVTDAFSKALVIGGANTKEAAAATLQFAQALGSGKLAGDEFRSIAEASPRVLQAIADGTGKTTGELKKLASEGFLTTATVTKALLSQLVILRMEMESIQPTVKQAFGVLGNNLTSLIGGLNESTGATASFANGIISIANLVPTASQVLDFFSKTSQTVSSVLNSVGQVLLVAGAGYVTYSTVVGIAAASTTSLSVAQGIAAISSKAQAVALGIKTAALGAATVATNALTAAILANPAGFILKGIAVAAGLVASGLALAFGDNILNRIYEATAALLGFRSAADKASSAKIFNQNEQTLEKDIKEVEERIKKLQDEVDSKDTSKKREDPLKKAQRIEIENAQEKFALGKLNEEKLNNEIKLIQRKYDLAKKEQELINKTKVKDVVQVGVDKFNLTAINAEFDQKLSNENRLQQYQKAQIDASLQYRLISEAEAYVRREKLAEDSYKNERRILEEQLSRVSSEAITGKTEDQKKQQEEAKRSAEKTLKLRIEILDADRKNALELAKINLLGKENERRLEAENKLSRIKQDIQQDVNVLLEQQANQYKDPAIVAAEQARVKAADKYTETIAKLVNEENFLRELRDKLPKDTENYEQANKQLNNASELTAKAREEQKKYADEIAKTTQKIIEQNRTFEAGIQRAIANRDAELKDFSKSSEAFMKGFYDVFDSALERSVKEFRLKFGSVFRYIRDEIKKLLIQQLVLQPIKAVVTPIINEMGKAMLLLIYKAAAAAFEGDGVIGILKDFGSSILDFGGSIFSGIGKFFTSPLESLSKLPGIFSNGLAGISAGIETSIISIGDYLATSQSDVLAKIGTSMTNNTAALTGIGNTIAGLSLGYTANRFLSGGYEVGGAVGNLAKNGAAIGQLFTLGNPLGGIVGGLIGGAINGLFGKKVTQTAGVEGTIGSGGFTGQNFVETVTKRRFRSTKVDTQYSALEAEYEASLDEAIRSTYDGAKVLVDLLGTGNKFAIDSYSESGRFFIRNTEELQATVTRLSNALLERAIPSLKEFQKEGEDLSTTALRVATTISGLNAVSQILGNSSRFSFNTFGVGEDFAKSLQNEDFQKALDFYVQNFADKADVLTSKSNQFDFAVKQLGISFDTLNATSSKETFANLIKNLDLTTEGGQQMLGSLLALAPALKEIIDLREQEGVVIEEAVESVEQAYTRLKNVIKSNEQIAQERIDLENQLFDLTASSTEIRERERNALDSSNRALFDQIKALEDQKVAAEDASSRLQEIVSERKSLEDQLFNLTASSTEIRERERNALDSSNRSLFDRIKALEDEKVAAEEAAKAVEEQRQAFERFIGFGKSIREFVDSFRIQNSAPRQSLSLSARSFNETLSLARVGNEDALQSIPDISKTYLDVAKQYFGSSSAYQKIQEDVLMSLETLPATRSYDAQQVNLLSDIKNILSEGVLVDIAESAIRTIESTVEVIQKGNLTPDFKLVLESSSSTIQKTVEALNKGTLNETSKDLLKESSETIKKTIEALNSGTLNETSKDLLKENSETIQKTVEALNKGSLNQDQKNVLSAVTATIDRTIRILSGGTSLSQDQKTALSASSETISQTIEILTGGTSLTPDQKTALSSATRTIDQTVRVLSAGTSLTPDQKTALSSATRTIDQTVRVLSAGTSLTPDQKTALSSATRTIDQTVRVLSAGTSLTPDQKTALAATTRTLDQTIKLLTGGTSLTEDQKLALNAISDTINKTIKASGGSLTDDQRAILEGLVGDLNPTFDADVTLNPSGDFKKGLFWWNSRNLATESLALIAKNTSLSTEILRSYYQNWLDSTFIVDYTQAGGYTSAEGKAFVQRRSVFLKDLIRTDFDQVMDKYAGKDTFGVTTINTILGFLEDILSRAATPSALGNVFSGGSVVPFAKGGAFTNSVVSSATLAPMALFGEAGAEAIMPLRRGPDGSLGVVAMNSNSQSTNRLMQQLIQANSELNARVDHLTRVLQTYAKADLENSSVIIEEQKGMSRSMKQAAEAE